MHTSLRIFQFVVIHIGKGFSVVNEAEVDVFLDSLALSMIVIDLWFLCLFYFANHLWEEGNVY